MGSRQVVGRERERAVLDRFLTQAAPQPRALLYSGEAGSGKTTLIRAAVELAHSQGLRVLEARPAIGEAELPYAALGDLLDPIEPADLAHLAEPQSAALEAALGRRTGSDAVQEYALRRGLLELLRACSAQAPLLLVVDDVQWLDASSESALTFALRRIELGDLRVVVAQRISAGITQSLPLGLGDWSSIETAVLEPMSATDLGALIRHKLGIQLTRPRLEAIATASAGNPMFALELAAERDLSVGTSGLTGALACRLRAIDPSARRAVDVAAAALRPTTELLDAAGVAEAEVSAAVRSGLIEQRNTGLAFTHPLLADVAYSLLLPEERRRIHARLAGASTDPVERGHHVSRCAHAPDEAAAGILETAAEDAIRRADHALAATFYRRAAELSHEARGERWARREVLAASELAASGDVADASTLLRELVEHLPPGPARARAQWVLIGSAVGPAQSYEAELRILTQALDEAAGDDALIAEMQLTMAEASLGRGEVADGLDRARLALAAAERAGAGLRAAQAQGYFGFAEGMAGAGVTPSARAAVDRWDGTLDWAVGSPRLMLACTLTAALELDEAEQLLMAELTSAMESGFEVTEVVARGHLAEVLIRAGRWAEALAHSRTSYEHARQAAIDQITTATSAQLAMTLALLGEHDEARAIASAGVTESEAVGDFWFIVWHRCILGLISSADSAPGRTVEALEPAWELMVERRLGDLALFPVAAMLGEALVLVGRTDDAADLAETLSRCPVGSRPWSRMVAERTRALVASARGDHAAARTHITDALAASEQVPEPFEFARTVLVAARVERNARSWGVARERYVEALERFDLLGAARWAEQAAAGIARLPGRQPGDKHELTLREREVFELVRLGLSNKEIASRLVLSVSTVEGTLSRIFAKTGVRSRTELATRADS